MTMNDRKRYDGDERKGQDQRPNQAPSTRSWAVGLAIVYEWIGGLALMYFGGHFVADYFEWQGQSRFLFYMFWLIGISLGLLVSTARKISWLKKQYDREN